MTLDGEISDIQKAGRHKTKLLTSLNRMEMADTSTKKNIPGSEWERMFGSRPERSIDF